MIRPITLMFIAGAFLSTSSICAAENADKQAAKDAALELCMTEISKSYKNAEVTSKKAKRKKIGKVRGYAYSIRVTNRKSLVCLAVLKARPLSILVPFDLSLRKAV